jgi:exopolyphosphatase/guanosine-5'-triphosphate,3'-diphosphate pyrophosphatase
MGNDPPLKAAAVDLGSNSFRLLIVELEGNRLRPVLTRLETIGLGEGLTSGGILSAAAQDRAFAALHSFRRDLDRHCPHRLRVCGTEALRQADNSQDFLTAAKRILGRRVEILTGDEEAHLTFEAIADSLELPTPLLIADVGGGSTELIFVRDRSRAPDCCSLPLGALSLTERFPGVENGDRDKISSLRRYVRDCLRPHITPGHNLVGSGGTITALAALLLGLKTYDRIRVHGSRIAVAQLNQSFDRLASMTVAERCKLFGLENGRGRIIIAGLIIFQALIELCRAEKMLVSDAGLLEGIILSVMTANGTLPG